jgi:hypothetical protein
MTSGEGGGEKHPPVAGTTFDRYNITAARDNKLAAQCMDERLKAQKKKLAPGENERDLSIITASRCKP